MGQDLELDFKKYCVVERSPKTVLLSPRRSKVEKRKVRKKPKCGNEVLLSQDQEFTEISLCQYASSRLGVDEAPKRGSVYQSSIEVGKMNIISKKETERRKKIEFSRSSGPKPFEIFDSLCGSDDDDDGSVLDTSLSSINTPLNKSLSSRLLMPHSPTKSESDSSKTTSPKNRSSPFRKMFDPFTKSKTHKSPLNEEPGLRKSLIHDFSNTKCGSKDSCSSAVSSSSSPAHLRGVLKLGTKNWMPDFEFTVKNPDDVLVAKTCKVGNGTNWVYTFHTTQNRRKINHSGRRFKDFKIVGQMQVSCYLCTELVNAGAIDNSVLTEFVLYDLTRPKESVSQIPDCSNVKESESASDQEKVYVDQDLHPDLETAAIVIQFPSERRESLKCKGDDSSRIKLETKEAVPKVSVVIPSGNHGLPSDESHRPSPLLDRWRLGGGCDCGGWDMGCPVLVFGNNIEKEEACKQPVELFRKGTKDTTPALTMKVTEEGQYTIDFHAQLTSLQAFSVCVAILHGTEASISVPRDKDKDRQVLQCDSLRVFGDDEVKHLITAVAEEEEKRKPVVKNDIPPSFLVDPPFSPMSRA